MKRLLWLVPLLLVLILGSTVSAQDDQPLPLEYTFIDGTRFNYPTDFSIYDEEDDGVFIANDETDLYIFTLYERSQVRNNINSLPEALDAFLGDNADFEPKDFVPVRVDGREVASFTHTLENDSGSEYQRTVYAIYVGDNGTIAIISVIPVSGFEITETDRVLEIIGTIRYVDNSLGDTVLGNAVDLPNDVLIEHRDAWTAEVLDDGALLRNDRTELRLTLLSAQDLGERGMKDDPVDVLFASFQPFDETLTFDASQISFPVVAGREVTRYRFSDVRDGQRVEHIYLVFQMDNGLFVVADIVTTDPLYTDRNAVEEMLLTLRMQGEPPPYRLTMDSSYNLPTGATVRFPDNWVVIPGDNDTVSINSVETNIFVLIYTEADAREFGYLDGDLVDSLLVILSPLDESLSFSRADVENITLDDGREAVRLDYTETNESGASYDRIVIVSRLGDGSLLFAGVVPQPGLDTLTPETQALSLAIISTIASE
jgi:hypothetical protein